MTNRAAALSLCAALVMWPCFASARTPGQEQQNNTQQANPEAEGGQNTNTWSSEELGRIVQQVRKQILSLSEYGVFDYITFGVQGRTIVLHGYASRPVLKSSAEKVVKGIEGVESVQNNIEVLPTSPSDDRIRYWEFMRIYSQPSLRKYTNAPPETQMRSTVTRMAGGITQDPPQGFHSIHIIVNNGHVILEGVVDNQMDAQLADVQANSVSGVFSVEDNLVVAGEQQKKEMK